MSAIPPFVENLVEHISPYEFTGIAVIANAFPAIPEEVFLISFGYLSNAKPGEFPFWEMILFLILGFLIIDSVVYYLTLRGSRIIKFLSDKVLDIDLKEKEGFLRAHAGQIVFISRFLVQLRAIGPITAATVGYPYRKFLMVDFLTLAIYTPALMGIGYYFADRVERILSGAHVINNIMLGVLGFVVLIIAVRRLRKVLLKQVNG